MENKEEKRKIPIKNYFILGIICIATILLTIYVNAWIKTYKESAYSVSPLSGVISEININELKEPFMEINKVILYVGYTNDQKLFNEEKELLNKIQKEELTPHVMYLNVDKEDDYISILQDKFDIDSDELQEAPLFIYIKDGKAEDVINVVDKNDLTNDFMELVEDNDVGDDY